MSMEQVQNYAKGHQKEIGIGAGAVAAVMCGWLAYRVTSSRGQKDGANGTRAITGAPGANRDRSNSALAHESENPPVPVRYTEATPEDRQASINKRMPDSVRKSLSHPPVSKMNEAKEAVSKFVSDATKDLTPEQKQYALLGGVALSASAVTALLCSLCRCCGGQSKSAARTPAAISAGESDASPAPVAGYGTKSDEVYTSEVAARQYMEFHFTPSRISYTHRLRTISEAYDFPTRIAQKFKIYGQTLPKAANGGKPRAIDIGCATGASVLAMSKFFEGGVIGIDNSEAFVHLAQEVLKAAKDPNYSLEYSAPVQGDIVEPRVLELTTEQREAASNVSFYAGDAMKLFQPATSDPDAASKSLPTASTQYDDVTYWQAKKGETFEGVLCVNLIDRVPDPEAFLRSLGQLVTKGGVLIMSDPYSWWAEATQRDKWIGGHKEDGVRSEDKIKEILSVDFDFKNESDEPFLIRDHNRHFQLGFSHCTIWKRKK